MDNEKGVKYDVGGPDYSPPPHEDDAIESGDVNPLKRGLEGRHMQMIAIVSRTTLPPAPCQHHAALLLRSTSCEDGRHSRHYQG